MTDSDPIRNVLLVSGAASFSTRDVWDGYCQGLKAAGLGVVPYPTFSMLRVLSPELIGNDIIGKALDVRNGIDAAIFVDGLYFRGRRQWVPKTLTQAGLPTILIATDDPYDEIPDADSIYTQRFTNEIRSANPLVGYLPTAANLPSESPAGQVHDVVFIGTVFEDRWPLLQQLARYCEAHRLRFLIAGTSRVDCSEFRDSEWVSLRTDLIPSEAKWKLYRGARVVVNIFRQSAAPADSPNPRIFEVAALGGPALLSGTTRKEVTRIFGDSVYQFDDFESLTRQLRRALDDETERTARAKQAQEITIEGHLYAHRAEQLVAQIQRTPVVARPQADAFPSPDRLCWIFGCARTGSTWLGEMLGSVQGIGYWHEPMFGKLFHFIEGKPNDANRPQSFYYSRFKGYWLSGATKMFYEMARERFPSGTAQTGLVVKEVNAPEFCPFVQSAFPASRYILLLRDPFDVLDSFLDMQRPGGWNEGYSRGVDCPEEKARFSANNIARSFKLSMNAYEGFPESQRLSVRYEDLIAEPAQWVQKCARLISVDVSAEEAGRIADHHRFENYSETGRLKHRRYGRSQVWRESENFTPEVRRIADEILGGLRGRLGYRD